MAFDKFTRKHAFIAGMATTGILAGGMYAAVSNAESEPMQVATCGRSKDIKLSDQSPSAVMINYAVEQGRGRSEKPYKAMVRFALSKGGIEIDGTRNLSEAQMNDPLSATLEPRLHKTVAAQKRSEDNWYTGKDVILPVLPPAQKVGGMTLLVAFEGNEADSARVHMSVVCTESVEARG